MAGREAALCRANWASELSCIIRRWARGVCTKHNSLVSCSGSDRAQRGASSLGVGQQKKVAEPQLPGGTPRARIRGVKEPSGESTYTRRHEMHAAKEGSVSGAALGQTEDPTVQGEQG